MKPNSTFLRPIVVALALCVLSGGALRAADAPLLYHVVAPATPAAPGSTIDVEIAVLNRSRSEAALELPATLPAAVVADGSRSEVTLQSRDTAPTARYTIAPGGFGMRTYSMTVPPGASAGLAALEVQLATAGASPTRAALEIAPSNVASSGARTAQPGATAREESVDSTSSQRPTTNLVRAQPSAVSLRNILAERLAPYEPTYFIYGPHDPAVKFQISFKYKLLDFSGLGEQRMARTLNFAYTQRALWDIEGESSPFFDTSYMPELMYQSLAPASDNSDRIFSWRGVQAAFKHESNGRAGPLSRSLNIVYARAAFAIGRLDSWHLLAMPEVFGYITELDDNPDLKDYRGYGKLQLVLGRDDGPSLAATLWAGKDFDNLSMQFDLTIPIRTKLLDFETYLLVQHFRGYGESLLTYREHSETVRAGFSLVR